MAIQDQFTRSFGENGRPRPLFSPPLLFLPFAVFCLLLVPLEGMPIAPEKLDGKVREIPLTNVYTNFRQPGLKDFDLLLNEAAQRAPLGELVDIMDVGFTCAYLATPYARRLSGETLYVDGGVNIMAPD